MKIQYCLSLLAAAAVVLIYPRREACAQQHDR